MLYNAGMKGLKGSADEGGVRVPFFVRWDGRIEPGRDMDRIAAHIDILPTLAALAGAELPTGQVEGRNLLPLIEDPDAEWSDRYLFTHKGRWKTGQRSRRCQVDGLCRAQPAFSFRGEQCAVRHARGSGQQNEHHRPASASGRKRCELPTTSGGTRPAR